MIEEWFYNLIGLSGLVTDIIMENIPHASEGSSNFSLVGLIWILLYELLMISSFPASYLHE